MGHLNAMRDLTHRLQAGSLRAILTGLSVFPLSTRRAAIGRLAEALVAHTSLGERPLRNLELVFPDMPARDRRALARRAARESGRTLAGIWMSDDLAAEVADVPLEGEGLEVLRAAHESGRGAILVSGHYGQFDAVRHGLRREGIEVGALYRPSNNVHYDPLFREGLALAGEPIVAKGPQGMREMLRHIRKGGFMAMLVDQYQKGAPKIDFLGHPARTTLSAAELALRYDMPLVPCFAPWGDGERRIVVEAPIPPSDPNAMMAEFNARLGSWVRRHPSQWYWLHRRWKR